MISNEIYNYIFYVRFKRRYETVLALKIGLIFSIFRTFSIPFKFEKRSLNFFFILQRQVFSALSQIAKHSVDLAEMVVEAEIFPSVLACLKDQDSYVQKNIAILIREIAKHTPEVSLLEDDPNVYPRW